MSDFVAGDEPILYQVVNNGFRYITTDAPDGTESSCAEYRRADLPPTPEQIMADPRVKALVEALCDLINQTHDCEKELTEMLHKRDFCGESLPLVKARTAIAAFTKEPKT